MPTFSAVTRQQVLRAIYRLEGFDRGRKTWPTSSAIARHLEAEQREVRKLLLGLRRDRSIIDRVRKGEQVWMPWGEPG